MQVLFVCVIAGLPQNSVNRKDNPNLEANVWDRRARRACLVEVQYVLCQAIVMVKVWRSLGSKQK